MKLKVKRRGRNIWVWKLEECKREIKKEKRQHVIRRKSALAHFVFISKECYSIDRRI